MADEKHIDRSKKEKVHEQESEGRKEKSNLNIKTLTSELPQEWPYRTIWRGLVGRELLLTTEETLQMGMEYKEVKEFLQGAGVDFKNLKELPLVPMEGKVPQLEKEGEDSPMPRIYLPIAYYFQHGATGIGNFFSSNAT